MAQGATLSIVVQNSFAFSTNPFNEQDGSTPLANGDLVQLGYFTTAGPGNGGAFDNFVNINTVMMAIGVGSATPGGFSSTVEFRDGNDGDVPVNWFGPNSSNPIQFGIRYFDAATEGAATFFNTVTHPDWVFQFESDDNNKFTQEMILEPFSGDQNQIDTMIWEGGPASAFNTSVEAMIPEPSTSLSALLGFALLAGSRRRN